jgi:hypothetical protein
MHASGWRGEVSEGAHDAEWPASSHALMDTVARLSTHTVLVTTRALRVLFANSDGFINIDLMQLDSAAAAAAAAAASETLAALAAATRQRCPTLNGNRELDEDTDSDSYALIDDDGRNGARDRLLSTAATAAHEATTKEPAHDDFFIDGLLGQTHPSNQVRCGSAAGSAGGAGPLPASSAAGAALPSHSAERIDEFRVDDLFDCPALHCHFQ